LRCRDSFDAAEWEYHIHQDFSETILRMTMRAHRLGQDTSKFLALLSHHMKPRTDFRRELEMIGQEKSSAIARIHEGSMLIRQQSIFLMPCTQNIPLPWTSHGHIPICDHIRFYSMSTMYKYGIDIPASATMGGEEHTGSHSLQ
jgi:hypothetical protein